MTQVDGRSLPADPRSSHPPRKLRNFLLEPKFQLKYSGMVVGVTVVVAAVLGYLAYRYSAGQTELQNLQLIAAKGEAVDAEFISELDRYARQADQRVMLAILMGIAVLTLALGATSIVITHRMVGPAYRLKRMLAAVSDGQIAGLGALRKHDELQDVFEAFQRMTKRLREARQRDVQEFDAALEKAKAAGLPDEALGELRTLRDRLARALDQP
jgi:methyl-accepting chemotaxis protein